MLALKLNIPGNPYDHFFLITMASSRIDRFLVHMPYMGTDISLGDSMLYEWELYTVYDYGRILAIFACIFGGARMILVFVQYVIEKTP